MENNFIEDIENLKTTNFKINKIPVGTLKEFKEFCKEKCGNTYFIGIRRLLDIKKEYENLIPILSSIYKELAEIKNQDIKKEVQTFG
ncbi:MAG: hypothetical protein ACTSUC_09620 [Promethearchaeota archaeon]